MENIGKQKIFIIKFLYFVIILGIIIFLFKSLSILFPFIIAFSIAVLLKKPADLISKYFKISRRLVGAFILILFYLVISAIIFLFGAQLFKYLGELFQELPEIYLTQIEPALNILIYKIQDIIPEISRIFDLENMNKHIMSMLNSISITAVNMIASMATSVPSFIIKFIFAIIASFLFMLDYYKVTSFIMRQFPVKIQKIIINVKDNIFGTIFKFIKAYMILMFVTFIELSIGLSIFGIENAIILAAIIAFLDVLPAIGVGGVLIPWSIIEFIKGNINLGIGLLVIYGIITIVRYILEARVIGKQIGLHPLITLVSMFLGAEIFGILGVFIFPIIATILKYLNDSGTVKFFK